MKITEKKQPHVNTHGKDTRVNTQQREITSTSKRNESTPKGKTQLKTICLSCSLVFLLLGISPTLRGTAQSGESTCHLLKQTSQKETRHTWKSQKKTTAREHTSKRHTSQHTTKRENTSKRHENTPKGKTQLKTICLSFSLVFLLLGVSPTKRGKAQRGESTCHLLKQTSQKETRHTWKSQKKTRFRRCYGPLVIWILGNMGHIRIIGNSHVFFDSEFLLTCKKRSKTGCGAQFLRF